MTGHPSTATRPAGLSGDEAARRLAEDGPNELPSRPPPSAARLLASQLANTITAVLVGAAVVTAVSGDLVSTTVIAAVLLGNALIGFAQQRRAQQALAALQALSVPHATVVRDGRRRHVAVPEVVAGDLLVLEAGDVVPADGRLVSSAGLRVTQAALTGEAVAVDKDATAAAEPAGPAAEDPTRVLRGTAVALGRGEAVVTATGPRTEIGRIAELLDATPPATPLQRRLAALGRAIALAACALCALVFVIGVARGEPASDMLVAAASLAVAAIPESLPAVVTVSLALGAERMARRRAIARRLLAVETLGSVDVICSDKTGTLTEGAMVVERVWTLDGEVEVTGDGYAPTGELRRGGRALSSRDLVLDDALLRLLRAAALCNDAHLVAPASSEEAWTIVGDPTEAALVALTAKAGLPLGAPVGWDRTDERPFDAAHRHMTTVHRAPDGSTWTSAKGAVEAILALCTRAAGAAVERPLAAGDGRAATDRAEAWAHEGYRVLALAGRTDPPGAEGGPEGALAFLGLVAMADPPRPRAAAAVAQARRAGIRPVMITGDHPTTAAAIARRLGILDGRAVMTGQDVAGHDPDALRERVAEVAVFARTSPEQKLDIIRALQAGGATVAMTGDGVNDAPALQHADIGVAMGRNGTEVAKEAADLVLADDDFATIVTAVEEGRRIHDNIRRFVRYGLTGGTAEIGIMLAGPLVGLDLPLLAVQILWVNLLTHGLPGVALGFEQPEAGAMDRPPLGRSHPLLDRALARQVALGGLVTTAAALGVALWGHAGGRPWQTMLFTTLTLLQLGTAIAVRSDTDAAVRLGWRGNPALAGALAVTLAAQVLAISWGPLVEVLHTERLTALELLVVALASTTTFLVVEAEKALRRRRRGTFAPGSGPAGGASSP